MMMISGNSYPDDEKDRLVIHLRSELEEANAQIESLRCEMGIMRQSIDVLDGMTVTQAAEIEQLEDDTKDMALLIRRLAASIPLGRCDARLKAFNYLKRKGFKSEIYCRGKVSSDEAKDRHAT